MPLEPIKVEVEATLLDRTSGECPGCGFDSLEMGMLVIAMGGALQSAGRFAVCPRCGYEEA